MQTSFDLYLKQIFELDKVILVAQEEKRRVVVQQGYAFKALNKTQTGAQRSLGKTLETIHQLLCQMLHEMQTASLQSLTPAKLEGLNQRLVRIKRWVHQSTAQDHLSRSLLRWIPFFNCCKTWQAERESIHAQRNCVRDVITQIHREFTEIKTKRAHQAFEQWMSALEEHTQSLIQMAKAKSQMIQDLVQHKSSQMTAGELSHLLAQVCGQLKEIKQGLECVKKAANEVAKQCTEFDSQGKKVIDLHLSIEEKQRAKEEIAKLVQELTKISNSAILFLEASLADETHLFFTPIPDPEMRSVIEEATTLDLIRSQIKKADILVNYCHRLLKSDAGIDQIAQAHLHQGALTLAYMRTQAEIDRCLTIIEEATQRLPNRSFREKIKKETTACHEAENQLKAKTTQLAWRQFNLRWNIFLRLKQKWRVEAQKQVESMQKEVEDLRDQVDFKKQVIAKFQREATAYEIALGELKPFLNRLDALSALLRQSQILDDDNRPLGEVNIVLTNPVTEGTYRIPSCDLVDLAKAYSRYLDDLADLQRSCSSASKAYSVLLEEVICA